MPENEAKPLHVLSEPSRTIPKLCTGIGMNKLDNGDVILSFFSQNQTSKSSSSSPVVLIETMIMTAEHAQKLIGALTDMINDKKPDNE
jgi:hypothetical protein